MRPHLAGILIQPSSRQRLEDFRRNIRQGVRREAYGSEPLQRGTDILEMLHSQGGRLGFELVKHRVGLTRADRQS